MDQLEMQAKSDLDGILLDYKYHGESGPHYVVSVHGDVLDFASPWPGDKPSGRGVDYRARKIQEGLYLVHWIVQGEIHVALLLDFVNKKTTCAALMPGKTELWDVAHWDRWVLPSDALNLYQGKGKPIDDK